MIDDRYLRHELRKARRHQSVQSPITVPAGLDDEPPTPQWMRPVPRRASWSSPMIVYQRSRYTLRRRCDRLPGLKYLARVVGFLAGWRRM